MRCPASSTWFAKVLPLTHGLALVRYGLLGDSTGLHNIWSMHNTTVMATLSLAIVAVFAAALTHHLHPRLQPLCSPLKKRRAKERHKTAIRWRGSYPETSLSPYQTKSPRWPYRAPAQWTNGTFAC